MIEMILVEIRETKIKYALYRANEKIDCILRTYYGHHPGGSFVYAYREEYIPVNPDAQ